jgi:hypothetical protein
LNHAALSAGSVTIREILPKDIMENATGTASVIRENLSVSPTTLNKRSPQLAPVQKEAKMLPNDYTQCEFSDLVELIGMSNSYPGASQNLPM